MKISKKRILNVKRYLTEFEENESIKVGIQINTTNMDKVMRIGFGSNLMEGQALIPNHKLSKKALENKEGKYIVRKDLPKETAERYFEWSWQDWNGNSYSDYRYIPYQRYQREYIPPKLYEMIIVENEENEKWVVSNTLLNNEEQFAEIKEVINLFLSIFGECEVITDKIKRKIKLVRQLKWELLKQGVSTKEQIEEIINENVNKSKVNMYKRNIKKLLQTSDDTIAIGKAEFSGYIVFMYSKKDFVILESLMPNNATYILDKNWEEVSKMTKTEVINGKFYKKRIYHYSDWQERINKYIA